MVTPFKAPQLPERSIKSGKSPLKPRSAKVVKNGMPNPNPPDGPGGVSKAKGGK